MSENRSSYVLTYLPPKEWSGNVRELINLIRRLLLFSRGQQISRMGIKAQEFRK